MFWPLSIYGLLHPKERYIWVQVRILHETEKAKKLVSLRFTSKKALWNSTWDFVQDAPLQRF